MKVATYDIDTECDMLNFDESTTRTIAKKAEALAQVSDKGGVSTKHILSKTAPMTASSCLHYISMQGSCDWRPVLIFLFLVVMVTAVKLTPPLLFLL
jgi:hypothetical protein